jgi:hypothetical protein
VTESIPPLDPGLRGPLREAAPAPAAVRARARERLLTAVAGLGAAGGTGSGGAGGPSGRTRLPAGSGIAAIAFVLGGLAGAGLYATLAPAPVARVVYVDRIAPPAPPAPDTTGTAIAVIQPPAASVTPPPSAAPLNRASQLSAERILLDEARAALAQGDPARAIDRLERHRRTFATPLLAEERDAMWIQALVKAGRYDEARARASAFQKRSPDSLFSSVVASAIDSIP